MINQIIQRDKKTGRFLKRYSYRKQKSFWDKDWIYNEYLIKGKSSKEISDDQKCSRNNILFWLNKYGIKRRNISEARKIKYWGQKGEDNPMWNKKGEINPNWKGGITSERQSFYQSSEWKNVCCKVWKRDKAICQRCFIKKGEGISFHIHHKTSFENKELRAEINNLVLLCVICHNFIHSKLNINQEFIGGGGYVRAN